MSVPWVGAPAPERDMSLSAAAPQAAARPLPPPRLLTAEALVRGLGNAQRLIGVASLVLALALLFDLIARTEQWSALPLALLWWSLAFAAALVLAARPRVVTASVAVVVGIVAGTGWVVAVLDISPAGETGTQYLVEALAWSLLFIGAVRWTAFNGIVWVVIGLVVGTLAVVAGQLVSGHPVVISTDRPTDALIMVAAYAAIGVGMVRGAAKIPALPEVTDRTAQQAASRDRERAASALVHDTALASLTLIRRSVGTIDDRLRAAVRADLDALRNSTASSMGVVSAAPREGSLAANLLAVVDSFRWKGLRVDVSGAELLGDAEVTEQARVALLGAMTAALDNVRLHAGSARADVAIGRTTETVTVMVVDGGTGFALDAVPSDRLGVRRSILERMQRAGGTARVWSSANGTTVLMSAPVCDAVDGQAS